MTETTANEQQPQGKFAIQKIYVKDLSFEAPNSPACFTEQWDPKVNLDLNSSAQGVAEHNYEVVLSITVTVGNNDKTAYLVEVQQAGIFHIEEFPDSMLRAMLGSFCPSILFPYAREAVSDIVTRGGFPQMLLNPINFDALYEQHLQQQTQQADTSQPQ
ncbi:MAG: protein-export chaperone SecB [Gammaproteobacteria bacterium]|nr:protein-export chaperone SecB [Gammaproteobacteria bacterium]